MQQPRTSEVTQIQTKVLKIENAPNNLQTSTLEQDVKTEKNKIEATQRCPEDRFADTYLPGITPEHNTLQYWLNIYSQGDELDKVWLRPEEIQLQNEAYRTPFNDLNHVLSHEEIIQMIDLRVVSISEKFHNGKLTFEDHTTPTPDFWTKTRTALHNVKITPETRVLLEPIMIHCGPHKEVYITQGGEARFSRNNCSMAKSQEIVEILFEYPAGMYFVRTRYSWGWIEASKARFSPSILEEKKQKALKEQNAYFSMEDIQIGERKYNKGSFFSGDDKKIILYTESGIETHAIPKAVLSTRRPLTRRSFLETLFIFLHDPYGWGGNNAQRDCSRLLMDVMLSFQLKLPRHSADQALSGSYSIDISNIDNLQEKENILKEANQNGIVFLHFPGHIMAYLGEDLNNQPTIFHSFSEYLEHCSLDEPPVDTLVHVDKITLSHLELGENTQRRSFIERATQVTVFANEPPEKLRGMAALRPAPLPTGEHQKCTQKGFHFWAGPRVPVLHEPVKLVLTSLQSARMQTAQLSLQDPEGNIMPLSNKRTIGSPNSIVGTFTPNKAGKWRILLGEGQHCDASFSIKVEKSRSTTSHNSVETIKPSGWNNLNERLYSVFISTLFDYPMDEEVSWKNLHTILQDKDRNILYNYLGKNEDDLLKLEPDCADLPYLLRAYFSWKLNLYMGYRKCSRGNAKNPPKCEEAQFNENMIDVANPAKQFMDFANGQVRNTIHSGSTRTLPEYESTDVYPIPLERRWLRPGTIYADPYGHVLMISGYVEQTVNSSGILFAIDAQPDGTIARKRFWRGNFLFSPETTNVGAGFKAFRPIYTINDKPFETLNSQLGRESAFAPYSLEQYRMSTEGFYDRMDSVINPRKPEPSVTMLSLVDSLYESVQKRVISIDNGEEYMKSHSPDTMVMPRGYAVFETTGPWEDFATPSRDMRLLIAIDTVLDFPDNIRRNADKYGILPAKVEVFSKNIEQELERMLKSKKFSYTKSNGETQILSLYDVVVRRKYYEVAYHPVDCVEYRWGAEETLEEFSSCNRRSSEAERKKVEGFREWFEKRRRPPR